MPVYDYKCTCGYTFECRQTFESEPFAKCSECGKMAHRQLHCPPIIFKGSGFYITDHRKDPADDKPARAKKEGGDKAESKADGKGETKGDSKSDSKGDSKSETKGDAKPAAKSEPKPVAKPASGASSKSESD